MNKIANVTHITPLREAFRRMNRSNSSGYDMLNAKSPRYDADLPGTV